MSWWLNLLGAGIESDRRLNLISAGVRASWLPIPELVVMADSEGGYLIPASLVGRFMQAAEGEDRP